MISACAAQKSDSNTDQNNNSSSVPNSNNTTHPISNPTSDPGSSKPVQLSVDINRFTPDRIICDPFSNPNNNSNQNQDNTQGQTQGHIQGLIGELYYQPILNSNGSNKVDDFIKSNLKKSESLFLSDLNIIENNSINGFKKLNKATLFDSNGNKINQNFALKLNSNILLNFSDSEGLYEFALISNNGSVLKLKSGNIDTPDEILIDNDGDHDSKLACSLKTVKLRQNVQMPIELSFYQTQLNNLTHVLLFRPYNPNIRPEPLCNQSGKGVFFNPANAKPMKAFNDLMNRGWKVLQNSNFKITQNKNDFNPCNMGLEVKISELKIDSSDKLNPIIRWKTDKPATSQVQLTNLQNLNYLITPSDNILRTEHEVQLNQLNLIPGSQYSASALSVSSDLGRAESENMIIDIP